MYALVGFCAANHGSFLPIIRYNLSVPSSMVKQSKRNELTLFNPLDGTDGCPDTSVGNYQSTLREIPQERTAYLHRGGSLKSYMTLGTTVQYTVGKGILCAAMLLHTAGKTLKTNSGNRYPSTMLKISSNIITTRIITKSTLLRIWFCYSMLWIRKVTFRLGRYVI